MEIPSIFCVNLSDSVDFTAPPISFPILRSASNERTFFFILPSETSDSDQQNNTIAHLKCYIEELFQISSPISLHGSEEAVLENSKPVGSFISILHRRIVVRDADIAIVEDVPESPRSTKTKTASDPVPDVPVPVRRGLSNEELCNQHGITSHIKIMLNRDHVKLPFQSCQQPVKITATVLDLSSVDPHNTLKSKRWWPSSIKYYSPQAELRRKKKLSKFQICPFPSCDFVSTTRGHLTFKHHLGAAHGQKPFICLVCRKRFRFAPSLSYHFKTHSDKKFACKLENCGFKSHSASVLTRHMKSHSGIKEFGCTVCQYRSNNKWNLKLHYDKMHGPKTRSSQ